MRKRFIALIACGALAATSLVGFAGCGGSGRKNANAGTQEDPYVLKVWGSAEQQEGLKQMVNKFTTEKQKDGKYFNISVEVCGEDKAKENLSTDAISGADIFSFANDQIADLWSYGALSPLTNKEVSKLADRMPESTVNFGYFNKQYYGYPFSADNGFFMYYDKSAVKPEHLDSLDDILSDLEAAGKKFLFEGETAWYTLSFAYGAGAEYEAIYEGADVKEVKTNLNKKPSGSQYSYGQLGGKMVADLVKNPAYQAGGNDAISAALTSKTFGAAISGTWEADTIKEGLGENYAATDLPNWKSSLDGKTYKWFSFAGGKLYGVNGYSQNLEAAHELAAFLVEDEQQMTRFTANGIVPSSKELANDPTVQSNIAVAAFLKQMDNSVVQRAMPQSYWDEVGAFATWLGTFSGTADELQARVDQMVTTLTTVTPVKPAA